MVHQMTLMLFHQVASRSDRGGQERLNNLLLNLSSYDAIDQAEIVNAKTWLDARTGERSSERVEDMYRRLEYLPAAVREQLARMGMLDVDQGRTPN